MNGINGECVDTSRIGLNMDTITDMSGLNGNPTDEVPQKTMTGLNTSNDTGTTGLNNIKPVTPDSSMIGLNDQHSAHVDNDRIKVKDLGTTTCNNHSKHKVNLMDKIVDNPLKHILEIWENDAKKRHWSVEVPRMSTSRMCKLK